jgi:parallel beta-helix repeat protein
VFRHWYCTRNGAVSGDTSRPAARRPRRSRWTAALGVGVILTGGSVALMASLAHADVPPVTHLSSALVSASVNSASPVVAAEDLRLRKILRTRHRVARVRRHAVMPPPSSTTYTLPSETGDTLVLTPSSTVYTVADLVRLAPRKFARMKDGSYLFSEHIAVRAGATLRLSAPNGLTVRLASGPGGFVSIVSLGGKIELVGQKKARLKLSSWDVDAGAPDTATYEGRAYVRTIDGQFTADYVDFTALGFWSGRTGGLALTGTALPQPPTLVPGGRSGSAFWGLFNLGDVGRQAAGAPQPGPRGPNPKYNVPAPALVSDRITNSSITGNAFGLFISGTNGISVSDTKVRDSLISGVVLHRNVTNGVLSRVSSDNSAGDGFLVDRASTAITLNQTTANDNGVSGFMVSGVPEANGPSVAGPSTDSYGNNVISNSTASGNGRYGIHVVGGTNIGVHNNRVTDTDMGIVVSGSAQGVSIIGNEIINTGRKGIALVDGVSGSTVADNLVDHTGTGVYVRNSVAEVNANTIQRAETHGVSLVGQVGGTKVSGNALAGSGVSALDFARSSGALASDGNEVGEWHRYIDPWYFWFKKLIQPLTFLWVMIALLLLVSLLRSRRKEDLVVHPYAHQMLPQPPTDASPTMIDSNFEPSRSSS